MICEKCGANNATTHIHTIVNGKVHEKHLCKYCAANNDYGYTKGNDFEQMLMSMFGDTVSLQSKNKIEKCSCCGSTFDDIAQNGKCGCSECYEIFYDQLLPYLKRVHGSIKHVGKVLNNDMSDQSVDKIDDLRKLLEKLVKEEKYEQAAVIRDKIKILQEDTK